jgi:hypothetical protein
MDHRMYEFKASAIVKTIFQLANKDKQKRAKSENHKNLEKQHNSKTSHEIDHKISDSIKDSILKNGELFVWLGVNCLRR